MPARWLPTLTILCAILSPGLAAADSARPDSNPLQVPITRGIINSEQQRVAPDAGTPPAADTARLLQRVPGGNVTANGGVSGQMQYRGLFGPRMNVLVDGMHINPGGPNWMDPPAHYVPSSQLQSMQTTRGIAPVTMPGESLGGSVRLHSRTGDFGADDAYHLSGGINLGAASANNARDASALFNWANNRQRAYVRGSAEHADDIDYAGGGSITDSGYRRANYGAGYGLRLGRHTLTLDYDHGDTDNSGNPDFPLDIEFLDSDFLRLGYSGAYDGFTLTGKLYYSSIDHAMNNYSLRPTPDFNPMMPGPDRRRVPAHSRGTGWEVSGRTLLGGGQLTLGVDGHLASQNATIRDPGAPGFFVKAFNDIKRNRYSAFAQWQGDIARKLGLQLGLRYNRFNTDAGNGAVAPGLPQPAKNLAAAFNAADRSRHDNNIDAVIKLRYGVSADLQLVGGLARKTRSPSYIERYAYIPLEATAGLADGNNYVGDVDLQPEVAYQVDLGVDWRHGRAQFTPRVFYQRIHDYITGVPLDATPNAIDSDVERVSSLNGDPTPLRFANTEAELYGFDAGWGYRLSPRWRADGVFSFVRGLRRDINDDLYRVAPASARAGLNYHRGPWFSRAELVLVADQNHISRSHNDARTADPRTEGYSLVNLSAGYALTPKTRISAGIDNLFNRPYRDHLAGYNRVLGSDVALGARLPGAGRSLFVHLRHRL